MMHSMYKITRNLVILVMRYVLSTMILLKSESTYYIQPGKKDTSAFTQDNSTEIYKRSVWNKNVMAEKMSNN